MPVHGHRTTYLNCSNCRAILARVRDDMSISELLRLLGEQERCAAENHAKDTSHA